jgi:hypothetical protein
VRVFIDVASGLSEASCTFSRFLIPISTRGRVNALPAYGRRHPMQVRCRAARGRRGGDPPDPDQAGFAGTADAYRTWGFCGGVPRLSGRNHPQLASGRGPLGAEEQCTIERND